MNSVHGTSCEVGFPIRKLPGQSLFASSPTLIAGYHVLHRLLYNPKEFGDMELIHIANATFSSLSFKTKHFA